MGSKAPDPPPPPDPRKTAAAQTGQNVSTAVANAFLGNVNQVTPQGTLSYEPTSTYTFRDPNSNKTYEIPRFTATQQLSPDQQELYDIGSETEQNIATIGRDQSARIGELLGTPMDQSTLPARPDVPGAQGYTNFEGTAGLDTGYAQGGDITRSYGPDNFSDDRLRVEQALMERMRPYLDRERDATRSQLANQGLMMGSEGYTRGIDDYNRAANDARLGAIMGAGEEQSRMMNMAGARAGFENQAQQQAFGQDRMNIDAANAARQQQFGNQFQTTAANNALSDARFGQEASRFGMAQGQRGQALQEQFALRNQPINEITALMTGSQVSQPNFMNTQMPQIPTTDQAGITQNAYNQQLARYNMMQQNQSNLLPGAMGGLFKMGAGALGNPGIF